MVGAINPRMLTGNHVIPPLASPQGYGEQLGKQLDCLKRLRPVQKTLPKGWEARITEDEIARVYFVDHNTKTTSWSMPVGDPLDEQGNKKTEMINAEVEISREEEARPSEIAIKEKA